MSLLAKSRIVFDSLALLLFVWMAYEAWDFARLARVFPLAISLIAATLGLLNLGISIWRWRTGKRLVGDEAPKTAVAKGGEEDDRAVVHGVLRALYYLGWTLGYVGLIGAIGLVAATLVFVLAFLAIEARAGWLLTALGSAVTVGALLLISDVMDLRWPESLVTLGPW